MSGLPERLIRPPGSGGIVWQRARAGPLTALRLFRLTLVATARQSMLGLVWRIVMALVPVITFAILGSLRVFGGHERIDPVTYVVIGSTLWLLLSALFTQLDTGLRAHKDVIAQSPVPLSCFLQVSAVDAGFDLLIRLVLVVPLTLLLGTAPVLGAVPLLLGALPALLFAVAGGVLVVYLTLLVPDLRPLIQVVFRYLIFVSLVIIPLPDVPALNLLVALNPFAVFIDNLRHLWVEGRLVTPGLFAAHSAVALVLAGLALAIHRRVEPLARRELA